MYSKLAALTACCVTLAAQAAEPACGDQPPTNPLTLTAAVDYALCHQPQTRAAWASIRSQQAGLDAAQAAYLPSLSTSVSSSYNRADGSGRGQQSASARLAYTLFDFGQRDARRDQAQALLDAAKLDGRATTAQVWLDTVNAYLNLASSLAQREAAVVAEQSADTARNAAEARLKIGSATPLDALQAKSAYAQAVLDRIKLDGQIASNQVELARLMALRPTQLPSLASLPEQPLQANLAKPDMEKLLDTASHQRSEVAAAEANLQAAEASLVAARAAGRPSLSLSTSADLSHTNGSGSSHGQGLSLSLDIPFDLNGSVRAGRAQAEAQRDSRVIELDRVKQSVQSDAWKAWYGLNSALETARAAELALDSAKQAFDVALGRYRAGLGDVLALLSAQSTLANARQQQVASRHAWLAARAQFAWALGGDLPADPANPISPNP